jgi:DNA mismatch endonuclease (patch repair protein)
MTQAKASRRTIESSAESWASSDAVRRVMRSNRDGSTRPEIELRSAVHRLGLRFRLRVPLGAAGRHRPDLVFPRERVAVFLDGCFWHGCPQHGSLPKTNAEYWMSKIARNQARDRNLNEVLRLHGWTVVRVWEHEDAVEAATRIRAIVVAAR